jgi:tetratricopeptide (TPR) repeat protein
MLGALLAPTRLRADMAQADENFDKRGNPANASLSLGLTKKFIAENPTTIEGYWKASRIAHWIADHETDRKKKLAQFEEGINFAKAGLAVSSDSVECHFWLAANYGSNGEVRGVLKSLFLVKPIRAELNEVVRLNPTYQGGGGYRVLGVVDYKVPGFAGGNRKRALEELNKAMAIDANNPFNQYYVAEYYSVTGNKAKALEHLDILAKLTPTRGNQDNDALYLEMMQKKGEALRATLK